MNLGWIGNGWIGPVRALGSRLHGTVVKPKAHATLPQLPIPSIIVQVIRGSHPRHEAVGH
ncbi:uncharacterized protein BDZ83DRAFT_629122 [Colletotrichum acutatum]|uniref:Uncharacterized protein n=1 Tax=Glomerella acutata TaxID=27357 RepID=A0AAD8UIL6_GLOAC|nr:uncharacterized protein BDZ83DRAFT_629122 [Colletotrichum acutatum]KAK1722360.1 hypothetical protein BDZ83DRAFT_629122 [Colletotrichum acutatum]